AGLRDTGDRVPAWCARGRRARRRDGLRGGRCRRRGTRRRHRRSHRPLRVPAARGAPPRPRRHPRRARTPLRTDARMNGKVAVVTGASRGIGRATAIELAKAGARVVGAARGAEGPEGIEDYVRCDVSDPDDVERLFVRAEEIGPPDILVCAAGILEKASLDDTTLDLWR